MLKKKQNICQNLGVSLIYFIIKYAHASLGWYMSNMIQTYTPSDGRQSITPGTDSITNVGLEVHIPSFAWENQFRGDRRQNSTRKFDFHVAF